MSLQKIIVKTKPGSIPRLLSSIEAIFWLGYPWERFFTCTKQSLTASLLVATFHSTNLAWGRTFSHYTTHPV